MLHPFRAASAAAAFALCVSSLSAQVQVRWFDAFDGPTHSDDRAAGLAVDASGNVYTVAVAGDFTSSPQSQLLKYAQDGALLWSRDILPGPEAVGALALDPADVLPPSIPATESTAQAVPGGAALVRRSGAVARRAPVVDGRTARAADRD